MIKAKVKAEEEGCLEGPPGQGSESCYHERGMTVNVNYGKESVVAVAVSTTYGWCWHWFWWDSDKEMT